ncbi:bifunctional UDP-N-acetylmuramoyl-tripeptide:D-alanyl-D-alanine ligase/alanine racemase [Flavobacterium sp.]|uniref:bifunctional UDP-N-acetylmuramoyl-tripeptide:D-alanyl-D-alanine ligase/alanine racemase n=1 Tax=Flavobacterium sp. TaxID=239 RepID=UPI002A7FC9D8|nr:bifunctional UDP-N-acetylmuramoyl-tripeptide:D-alanyl-D-alanine ligase/alanine racemase [Flavobacterium sp.]
MNYTLKHITSTLDIKNQEVFPDFNVENISIDSRSLQNNNGTLFFALKGNNHDGHQYIEQLIEKGVAFFVVEHIPTHLKNKAHFIVVKNTLKALQKTAIYYRNLFTFPTIGITGSNGKTIVKEWLNFLLSPDFNVVRSPKSYNSQVGVPLSIFGINENHNLGIFEAGISQKGEMEKLQEIIQPNIGVFTHLGNAHDESFVNISEKIEEKTALFKGCEVVVLEKNNQIEQFIKSPKLTWSFDNNKADYFLSTNSINNKLTEISISGNNVDFKTSIPFNDIASIKNATSCIITMLYLKYEIKHIQERVQQLYPIELRLQAKKGINNCLLIDDSYSSDYQSLQIALDFLEQQKLHSKKTIILSDVFQGGLPLNELYQKVASTIQDNKIDRVIAIGETISGYLNELPNVISFPTTTDFLKQFNINSFENETILIKGARNFYFDEIVVVLEEKNHETVLEINLDALSNNLNFYKSKLAPKTKIMVMVKAFGYGNGGYEIAKLLEHNNVDYLGVAFADEGISLRKAGIKIPIMVLNPENSSFHAMIAYDLEPEIYSLTGLEAFLKVAKQQNIISYPIHLKVDTGMHRLGFEPHDLPELKSLLKNNNFITVKSVFSHLAASDDIAFKEFTELQFNRLQSFYKELISSLHTKPIRHILNTSGIFNYPNYQMEMVRLGVGLYGAGNSENENKNLQNVSTLKSIISQIRTVEKGESIGYSRKYIVENEIKVATIPIGYADGIRRAWGNGVGYILINNQKAAILGNICMDMLMVDVSSINCNPGDEVVIFGEQLTVNEIAEKTNTISYEILTGISQRVKRIFYKN